MRLWPHDKRDWLQILSLIPLLLWIPVGLLALVGIQGTRTVAEADSIEITVAATTVILLLLAVFGVVSAGDPHTRNFVDWVSCLVGPLCLLPLLILWVLWSGARRLSFQMFMTRELIVLVSWVLAIIFSLRGFRKSPFKLVKFLNITTIVLA